jgi:hypothetical protein
MLLCIWEIDEIKSIKQKLKTLISLIRPVVTYGFYAWTFTNRDEQHLIIFEHRIWRKIFGPV